VARVWRLFEKMADWNWETALRFQESFSHLTPYEIASSDRASLQGRFQDCHLNITGVSNTATSLKASTCLRGINTSRPLSQMEAPRRHASCGKMVTPPENASIGVTSHFSPPQMVAKEVWFILEEPYRWKTQLHSAPPPIESIESTSTERLS